MEIGPLGACSFTRALAFSDSCKGWSPFLLGTPADAPLDCVVDENRFDPFFFSRSAGAKSSLVGPDGRAGRPISNQIRTLFNSLCAGRSPAVC